MAEVFWKFGNTEYSTNEHYMAPELVRIFNELISGKYDRDYTNVETICKFYNFLKLKGLNLSCSLPAIIMSWKGYEKAIELLENPGNSNLTTKYECFHEIFMAFEPRTYHGLTIEMINERMFELATKKCSLYKVLEYAKLIGLEDFEKISNGILGRYDDFMSRLGLTREDIIAFSKKYPYINMSSVCEIFDEKENERFVFIDCIHRVLGELLYEERPKNVEV